MSDITFRAAAAEGFEVLSEQFQHPTVFANNYWFCGNTLQTILDYLLHAKRPDKEELLRTAYNFYQSVSDSPAWWRDDHGWWGNAFVRAIKNQPALGYPSNDPLFTEIRDAAAVCWERMNAGWSEEPYSAKYPIKGGVFNTDQESPLRGRNSVTNEQFWLLSAGLSTINPNPRYSFMANAERTWFGEWLAIRFPGSKANGIQNEDGLILERPLGNLIDPSWYWSGDQGLFAFAAGGTVAREIALSVVANMTDSGKVLHENLSFEDYPDLQQFIGDYATGKGVLVRYLSRYVVGLGPTPPPSWIDFFTRNATAVWCNQIDKGAGKFNFSYNWEWKKPGYEPKELTCDTGQSLCDLIMQTAGQDALNAALYFTPDAPIVCPG